MIAKLVACLLLGLQLFYQLANAQVMLLCEEHNGYALITAKDQISGSLPKGLPSIAKAELIDTRHLAVYEELGNGRIDRVRSKSIEKKCGPFLFHIELDWHNPNPFGENGGEEFPVVKVFQDGKTVVNTVALGACKNGDGWRRWGECPNDWATWIEFYWLSTQTISAHREYEDILQ